MTNIEYDDAEELNRGAKFRRWWKDKLSAKIGSAAQNAESRYLGLLRLSSLLIATILLAGASIFSLTGVVKQLGSSDIEPELAQVDASDLIAPTAHAGDDSETENPKSQGAPGPLWKSRLNAEQQRRFFTIYKSKFEPSRRKEDPVLTRESFFEQVFPDDQIDELRALPLDKLSGADGKPIGAFPALADELAQAIEQAAQSSALKRQLSAYKRATKIQVCETKMVSQSRQISAWDSGSTNCAYWYEYPYGCPVTRTVQESVPTRACEMRVPETLKRPVALYSELVRRYGESAAAGVERQAIAAEERRAEILARKAEGKGALLSGGQWFLAFMAVMFLYLVVAIERHQRRLAVRIEEKLKAASLD
ncbi:hypothetical protein [Sphingopyxis sp. 113P3]|jgi:hypothetical protein|uniref:hypothetical protein n=1 Tax=Sphingopyxis sp. (strain 113P3) TaxID=292913 RepID=UPI0006AD1603|nr:hypothetical protein [Sphingopyxis sp. 113P3]ALC11156.1 hypothetical protein LH20_04240 [Sphingopyxis sp. 113P3]